MLKTDNATVSRIARRNGAADAGVCGTGDLPANAADIETILPGARAVVVVIVPHSLSAIGSRNIQVGQYDTIHTYNETARAAHGVALFLESRGHRAVAVPAFIPIDMAPEKQGMVGAVDWRRAAVCAGLGTYGMSGLLLTKRYGSAVRIGGVVTDAPLRAGHPLRKTLCTECGRCIEACPARALASGRVVDKKKCGDNIFSRGFRAWRDYLLNLTESAPAGRRKLLNSRISLELWQNFMTGNYYSCFVCQAVCPAGRPAPSSTVTRRGRSR